MEQSQIDMILQVVQQNKYVFIVMGIAVIVSIIYNIIRMKNMKAKGADFLTKHPDAAKVYLTAKALITSEAVSIHTVEGGTPYNFVDGGKTGFYVAPGRTNVQISYTYTRPGVLHKHVTTSTDVVDKVLETEARKSYILGFDRKAECFTFEEYQD